MTNTAGKEKDEIDKYVKNLLFPKELGTPEEEARKAVKRIFSELKIKRRKKDD